MGPDFVSIRNKTNDYLIDREVQKTRTFTGIRGIAEQDAMIQENQGVIADRTREILVATDAGIARFRKAVPGGAKALARGEAPPQVDNPGAYTPRSGSCVVDNEKPLEEVMRKRFGDPVGRIRSHSQQAGAPAQVTRTSTQTG